MQKKTKDTKKQPIIREVSSQTSLYFQQMGMPNYNPDDLVQKKGIQIYKTMKRDDQIKATLTMKKFARLATGWDIQPASEAKEDIEKAEFIKEVFTQMKGTFEDKLYDIYSALDYGFSVSELVYKYLDNGDFKGKVGLRDLKTRDPENYDFDTDEHGNLAPDGIIFMATERYPVNKFVIYSYNKEFSNWYGDSDLRACYRSWFSKEMLIRFYNIYLERFGMPLTKGMYKKGTPPADIQKLKEIMDNIQAKCSITIPEDIELDIVSGAGTGDAGYQTAIEMHNKFISRAILVPDLIGFTEQSGGSYAMGKKHFDVFLWILKKLGRDTEESIVNEQIIKPLIDFNWNTDKYPKFQFESLTEEDTEAKSRIVRMGVDGGFINPTEDWVRPYLNLPKKKPEVKIGVDLETQRIEETQEVQMPEEGSDSQPKDIKPVDGQIKRRGRQPGVPHVDAPTTEIGKKGAPQGVPKEKLIVSANKYVDTDEIEEYTNEGRVVYFDEDIDYQKLGTLFTELENVLEFQLEQILKRQKAYIKTDIVNKYKEVDRIQISEVGKFRDVLGSFLKEVSKQSHIDGLKLLQGRGLDTNVVKLNEKVISDWHDFANADSFSDSEFGKEIKSFVGRISKKAEEAAGTSKKTLLRNIKKDLKQVAEDQRPFLANKILDKNFEKYMKRSLRPMVRTSINDVWNSAKYNLYKSKPMQKIVRYMQYTAVLDMATRPAHRKMHGRIFKANSPIWKEWLPPNGWNCRCSVVPVTYYEAKETGLKRPSYMPRTIHPDEGFAKVKKFNSDLIYTTEEGQDG